MAATAKKTATTKTPVKKAKVVRRSNKVKVDELHAYVPDPQIALNYVGRKVWGVWDAVIADTASRENKNILLMGDTGSGKTLFGEAYASKNQMMYYSLACDVSIDPSSLFGRMQPTDMAGKFRWQDGPVPQVIRGACGKAAECTDPKCKGGVLNISEINFMTPKIAASLYPLLDGRRYIPLLGHEGEVVRAHHGTLIIADMNPQYRGTMELNAAFKNRFDFKIPWGYSTEVEEKLVKLPTMREIAALIRQLRDSEIRTPLSTNMLMEFESFTFNNALGLDFAIQNFLAAFEVDEQQPISKVFDLNRKKLESDIKFFTTGSSVDEQDDDLEEIEVEFEVEA